MKRPYGDNEKNYEMEQDRPSAGMNVFKTAKEQLVNMHYFMILHDFMLCHGVYLRNEIQILAFTG